MGWLLRYIVTLLLSLIWSFCTCLDKIVPGKSISGNLTLTSSLGEFSLGFFSPENSTKYFLGIQYNTFPVPAIVWVANREFPLDSPGVFMLGSDGNLVVLDEARKVMVWSSNVSVSTAAKNSTAGLVMDTGNLVLSFEEVTLWQSFDHPSDTLLPGMKISLNKMTGQQRRLTSWAAPDDPQPGNFTFGVDPKLPVQGFIWKENTRYWRSSIYVGTDTTTVFQSQNGSAVFFSYNFDVNEVYITYSVSDSSVKMRLWLNPTGQLLVMLWQGSSKTWFSMEDDLNVDNCDLYAPCGPDSACRRGAPRSSPCRCLTGFTVKFPNQWAAGDWSGGCVREKVLTCGNEILQGYFSKLEKVKPPDYSVLLENRSMSQCDSECQHNCSCTAYAYVNATDESNIGKCLAWFSELVDLGENRKVTPYEIYIRVYGSNLGNKGLSVNSSKRSLVIAIVSSAAGLLTIIFGYFLWKKKLGKEGEQQGE